MIPEAMVEKDEILSLGASCTNKSRFEHRALRIAATLEQVVKQELLQTCFEAFFWALKSCSSA